MKSFSYLCGTVDRRLTVAQLRLRQFQLLDLCLPLQTEAEVHVSGHLKTGHLGPPRTRPFGLRPPGPHCVGAMCGKRCQDSFRESRSRPGCRHGKTTTCGRSGRAWFSEPRTRDGVRATAGWASPNAIRVAPPRGQWPAHPAGPSGSTSRWPSRNCTQCVPASTDAHRWATRPGFGAMRCNSTSSQPCDHGEDRKTSPDTFPVPTKLHAVRTSVNRRTPLGDETWVRRNALQLNLQSTLRPRGRPQNES